MTEETAAAPGRGQPEPLIVASPDLLMPEGQRFLVEDSMFPTGKDGLPAPHFSVQEVAKFFFACGPDWLRWRFRPDDRKVKGPDGEYLRDENGSFVTEPGDYPHGYFVLDGVPLDFPRTKAEARYFTLADVERMAHALAQGGHIDGAKLTQILRLVKIEAQMHKVLP